MDLVANVMLGNSPTPHKSAPTGKAAGGSFAALLPFHDDQDPAPQVSKGGKNSKATSKDGQIPDAAQLAALNIAALIPQISELTPAKDLSPEAAAVSPDGKNESATSALTTGNPTRSSLPANALQLGELLKAASVSKQVEGDSSKEAATKDGTVPTPKDAIAQPVTPSPFAPKTTPKLDKASSVEKAQTTAKPEAPTPVIAKTHKLPEPAKPEIPAATEGSAVPEATKSAPVIQSVAAAEVRAALKQSLPAQSKIASTVAKTTVPSARSFAAGQNIVEPHAAKNTPAAPALESQSAQDAPKKPNEEAMTASTPSNQASGHDVVNAIARAVTSGSGADNSRQAVGTPTGNIPAPAKHEATASEVPVLPNSAVALHSARLLESLGQSELKVGMKMGELGNVEIRTQLHHDQLRAEISVERGDLGRTLAAELPGLQQKLHDHEVQATIVVNHQAAAGSGSFERGSQQQQQATTPMAHVFGIEPMTSISSPEEIRSADSALDVHI